MTMTDKPHKEYTAFDLFSHFTSLRQSGVNRDEAWFQICDAVPNMSDVVRNAFLTLAKNWERREGHKYHYRTQAKDDTLSRKQVGDVRAAYEQQQAQAKVSHAFKPLPLFNQYRLLLPHPNHLAPPL